MNPLKKTIITILIIVIFFTQSMLLCNGLELTASKIESFVDEFMKNKMEEHFIPGASIGIVQGENILLLKGYGVSNIIENNKIKPDTSVFRVASIAKAFTAIGTLQLVERGLIQLDSDINNYLKSYKIEGRFKEPITIRHLLTHTDGLEAHMIGIKTVDSTKIVPLSKFLSKNMASRTLPPGVMITYGNYATAILGSIIEDVTESSFEEYMLENVLMPLGMQMSTFYQPISQELKNHLVTEYRYKSGKYKAIEGTYSHMVSSGGFHSTVEDMTKFMKEFLREDSIFLNIRDYMIQEQFSSFNNLPGVTFGFFEHYENDVRGLIRDGDSEGAQSRLFILPKNDIGIFLSYNSNKPTLREEFISAFLDEFFPSDNVEEVILEGFEERINSIKGYYNFVQYSQSTFAKFITLFTAVKVSEGSDNTIVINPIMEEPFGGLGEKTILAEMAPYLFSGLNRRVRVAFSEFEDGSTYLFSGSGYHGSFRRLDWYENPYLHMSLFLFFLLSSIVFLVYSLIQNRKGYISNKYDKQIKLYFRGINLLNFIFIISIVPVLMLIGMKSYLPAYVQGINGLMIALFTLPIVSLILTILLFGTSLYRHNIEKDKRNWIYLGSSIISLLFILFLNYWNLFGYRF